ncbi:CubicO group peptidase (beta-lactamase class C family) [Amycolatopsis bartoniae]|uniref:1,4-butanediol diacrylate esterase n=1 Tax=Amycolatopsis bartoniae TaxID=941986 RepID=A0A8H9IUN5_9PSEU|nr:serine hydrolase [Amycolatopsis bartoniae]MBB2939443.1 CubicO group peptidase (beta-lactamase class C family) [Amycolatopsis bartoniae]TVT11341.1 beta-lactamase family protein [Amycolatopsis bartoniae]GHF66875.1 1,4-butanediol diacrylate esterase [Amycolatopsis bartoniae]
MSTKERIDALLAAAVKDGVAPGVVAVAATADEVIYRGAVGTGGNGPLSPDSVVYIASMTKLLTAIAALQQVEKGTLTLDAPIATVLPELTELQVLEGYDADGAEIARPAKSQPTLRQLLTHTGGFAYNFWNERIDRYTREHDVPTIVASRELTLFNPLVADPGTEWNYGHHLEWVGKAVERVSGLNLEDYLRQNVFGPLQLTGSGFVLGERRERLASMNVRTEDGGTTPIDLVIDQEPEFYMGGGGLYSTPEDYLTVLRMLLNGGTLGGVTILSQKTIEEARDNHIGELTVGRLVTTDPASTFDVEFLPGTTKKWSLLGMYNVEDTPGGRSAGSLFWAGLSNTFFWVDWTRGHAGALFTQMLPFADPRILAVFDEFEDAVREL